MIKFKVIGVNGRDFLTSFTLMVDSFNSAYTEACKMMYRKGYTDFKVKLSTIV